MFSSFLLSPSGDLGIGLVWDNHPIHPNLLQTERSLAHYGYFLAISYRPKVFSNGNIGFDDPKEFDEFKIADGLKVISNESMDFNDPKELDDPQLFDDPSYSMTPARAA